LDSEEGVGKWQDAPPVRYGSKGIHLPLKRDINGSNKVKELKEEKQLPNFTKQTQAVIVEEKNLKVSEEK
jgi:hypothetical protein